MNRTDGTMKVTVFETPVEYNNEMQMCAKLLGEAAEWLRNEAIRDVRTSAKKMERHSISNIQLSLTIKSVVGSGSDWEGDVMHLYVHYDDNEKG